MPEPLTVCSRPYAWPWHGAFEPRKTALLVVRDGMLAPPTNGKAALLGSLVRLASSAGLTVGELPERRGSDIVPDFAPDFVVSRPHYGGFTGTDLDSILRRRRITDLIIVGFPFEIGADCTMRQANDLGYECLALSDCCTGMSDETLAGALASIQMSGGIFGAVSESAAVLELFAAANAAHVLATAS